MADSHPVITRRAAASDVAAICAVCSEGWRETYRDLHSQDRIERVIANYYVPPRVSAELLPSPGWNGWHVAEHEGAVMGAGGGGVSQPGVCELYVLYVHPAVRYRGLGTASNRPIPA